MTITTEEADAEIHAFLKEFQGGSHLNFINRPRQEDFYGPNASIDSFGELKGGFLPTTRDVHLPLANFRDIEDFRQTLRHETLGHFGLLTFTEPQKRELLEAIIAARQSPSMKSDWEKIDKAYPGESDLMKAEEVFRFFVKRIDSRSDRTGAER